MGLFNSAFETISKTVMTGITGLQPLLELMKDDPAIALSILQTARNILDEGTVWISEDIIEEQITSLIKEKQEVITDIACCGLDSNRLLLYGEGYTKGYHFTFQTMISPSKTSIIWTPKEKLMLFEMSPIQIEGDNLTAKITQKTTEFVLDMILPSIFGSLAQEGLKKIMEALTIKKWTKELSSEIPGCTIKKNTISLDIEAWEPTQYLLNFKIPETKYTSAIHLHEILNIGDISIDRKGITFNLILDPNSQLIKNLHLVWDIILNFGEKEASE